MKYKVLTDKQTQEWISTLKESIEVGDAISERWKAKRKSIVDLFIQKYQSKWYWRMWMSGADEDELFFSYSGQITHFHWLTCSHLGKLPELTDVEVGVMYIASFWDGDDYDENAYIYKSITSAQARSVRYKTLLSLWEEFAGKPFEVNEDDIVRYNDVVKRLASMKKILQDWDNEA